MKLFCPICNTTYDALDGHLICPNSSPKHTHPLQKCFNTSDASLSLEVIAERWNAGENGYSIFRECLGSFAIARETGCEQSWLSFLQNLESNARKIHPAGFDPTPLVSTKVLAKQLGYRGGLYAKNETKTILGSHKARHAIASILYLEAIRKAKNNSNKSPLAIFSCGNAALGAAAIAKAANYTLYTFVPATLSSEIESLLSNMDAYVVKVKREGAVGQGDPCNNLYQKSIREFCWTAFSCYGHDLWASIEGAEVMALELAVQVALEQTPPERLARSGFDKAKLDSVIVQVGGGGLANGTIVGLRTAVTLGLLHQLPRIFLAQTESCYPLAESYVAIIKRIVSKTQLGSAKLKHAFNTTNTLNLLKNHTNELQQLAQEIAKSFSSANVQNILAEVAAQRGNYFLPWSNNEPHSIAEGILDDTTYDGFEIATAMLETGGIPCTLSEDELAAGWKLGCETTRLNVSATGTAGLSALISLQKSGAIKLGQNTAILFTGVESRIAKEKIKDENVVTMRQTDTEIFLSLPTLANQGSHCCTKTAK